jgi:hypothetical protein
MNIKKVIVAVVLLMVILFSLPLLINYLTMGKLVITTNSSENSITLSSVNKSLNSIKGSAGKGFSKQAMGSLSVKLKAGNYTVSVQNGSNSTAQYVKVKSHHTEHLKITLLNTTGVEPVVYDNAQDIIADNSHLLYLDPEDSTLNQINSQDQHSESDDQYGFQSIQWADTSYGVGQNAQGQLFVVNKGSVSALQSPVSDQNDASLVYAVAPNRDIYIALGSSVYSGTATGGFKKIYSQQTAGSFLVAGSDKVAIVTIGDVVNSQDGNGVVEPSIVAIDDSGKQVQKNLNATAAAWSEHARYLAVVTGSAGEILNASLQQIATIPQRNFGNLVWLDDNTLFYSVQDQLWSYNLQTQSSRLIANMPLAEQIQEVKVSTDKAYVYLTTSNSNNDIAVRRVGLLGQKVPGFIYQLQDILPQATPGSGYGMGLYNFAGKPTISVVLTDGSDSSTSLQSAMQELQSDGFDLNQLQFEVEQGD